MTEYQIEITNEATNDIENISFYISYKIKNTKSAKKIINGLLETINKLSVFPERFKILEGQKDLRSVKYKKYLVIYKIMKKELKVSVSRILYGKRDLNKILNG